MQDAEVIAFTQAEDRHWWYRERRAIIAKEVRDLRPGKAVEIGAGGGGNSLVLKELGWDVLATEYTEAGVRIAKERGLNALQADATQLPLDDQSQDLFVAFDVLEHIEQDREAAAEIFRVLRPGGTALIAVPCDMALWSAYDEASHHFRRYTRETLTELISGAGLTIDSLRSWNVLLRPVVKLRRKTAAVDDTVGDVTAVSPVVNLGLGAIIKAERFLPVGSLPGVSLMMRAHRPG
ncbi:MAG: class I SAM-dependent methyltransferase [Hamadaea sp.]|uniref:class I SAM-dependent methyltransferase n=1 Tax=Hamadaea sp. NPDC050747 TaxID=3155789 RepID=UPI0018451762|nr:class I SAM-dependent methyltransferase [Hamadaea sp.]NUR50885.1 class I SAM-dependent methyltransferase [Hamadaea sp.]NUT07561.1 class I SAM-dependent methyltransferase [Hamadaea sp.]